MRRFEKLKVLFNKSPEERSFKYLFQALSRAIRELDTYDGIINDHCDGRSIDIRHMLNIAELEHLEIAHPFSNSRELALAGANIAVDFFFGDWRKSYRRFGEEFNEAKCRQQLEWVDPFRDGLCLALLVSEFAIAQQLASYVAPDLEPEDPKEYSYYLIALAAYLSMRPDGRLDELRARIVNGKRLKPKLLFAVADAWSKKDAPRFEQELTDYLKYFQKKEFDPESWIDCFSVDATILWNLARLTNLEVRPISPDLMDFVITVQIFSHEKDK